MTAVDTQASVDEIASYADGVRGALADLPAEARDELLEDLPAHLAEVLAEDSGSLTERLGPPAAYAAELRAAAGIDDGHGQRRRGQQTFTPAAVKVAEWLALADRQLGRLLGYERAADYGRLLRPAWWLLRGYIVGMLLVSALQGEASLLPSSWVGWLVVLPLVIVSIRLGPLTSRVPTTWRVPLWTATAILVLIAMINLQVVNGRTYPPDHSTPDPFAGVSDVYPYDREGRPLTGVRLYDQHGQPLYLGDRLRCPVPPTAAQAAQAAPTPEADTAYEYPLCRAVNATPSAVPSATPSAPPSAAPSAPPSPAVSPTR